MAKKGEQAAGEAREIAAQVCKRIRELRGERGWSLETLSASSSVSRSMISQIEREEANPTLAVTLKIAHAFDMSLGELVASPDNAAPIDVTRADDEQFVFRADTDCRIRTLSPLHLEKDVEIYELRLYASGELRSAPHFKGTREFMTLQKGRVRVHSGDSVVTLAPGDSASYRADLAHSII
ncbi:MAG: transcriptional regulator with XRE-family HTH domain, partial [Rhodothermales bacterium]